MRYEVLRAKTIRMLSSGMQHPVVGRREYYISDEEVTPKINNPENGGGRFLRSVSSCVPDTSM